MNRNWNVPSDRLKEAESPLSRLHRRRLVPVVFGVSLSWPVKVAMGRPETRCRNRFIHYATLATARRRTSIRFDVWN